jgi:L-ribulose-5-phosphate 4-epimerase
MDDAARYVSGVKTEVAVARIRERVAALHLELSRRGFASIVIAERVPGADLFVTRPGEALDDELAPENMMLCTLEGVAVPETPGSGGIRPLDAVLYGHLLRGMPDTGALVHVESGYAAAWAARGAAIPCLTTQAAHEFGGEVPVVGDPASDAGELAATIVAASSPAVLVPHLGAFCVAENARAAVRRVLVLEGVARTAHLAAAAGTLTPVPTALVDARSRRRGQSGTTITDDRR